MVQKYQKNSSQGCVQHKRDHTHFTMCFYIVAHCGRKYLQLTFSLAIKSSLSLFAFLMGTKGQLGCVGLYLSRLLSIRNLNNVDC